jgi:uncharacterized protein
MTMSRRQFLAGLTLGGAGLLAGGWVYGAYRFETSRHDVPLAGLKRPLRLVQLSDLHYGPFVKAGSLEAWVAAAMAENPDLIVITGDFVDALLRDDLAPLEQALSGLAAPLGVWGVWGNHDHGRFDRIEVLGESLTRAGARILSNEGIQLREDLYLAGVDDKPKRIRATLRGWPRETACVLLIHNPYVFTTYGATAAAPLTLCGHTHGGQVDLLGTGAPWLPEGYRERLQAGWLYAPNPVYVSRGLGVTVAPVRINCPAELAVFDLWPE